MVIVVDAKKITPSNIKQQQQEQQQQHQQQQQQQQHKQEEKENILPPPKKKWLPNFIHNKRRRKEKDDRREEKETTTAPRPFDNNQYQYHYRSLLPLPTIQHQLRLRPATFLGKLLRRMTRLFASQSSSLSPPSPSSLYDHYYEEYYNPQLAYEMAVLSTLSYWEFQKGTTNNNTTGFALLEPTRREGGTEKYHATGFSFILKNCHPITLTLSLMMDQQQQQQQQQQQPTMINNNNNNSKNNKNPYYQFEYFFYNWHEPTSVKGVTFHDTDVLISTTTSTVTSTMSTSSSSHPPSSPSTPADTLIITFSGTSSVADAVTNMQTFEPANHSKFFEPIISKPTSSAASTPFTKRNRKRKRRYPDHDTKNGTTSSSSSSSNTNCSNSSNSHTTPSTIQGSLHRGFLNAYSRVERGSVVRFQNKHQNLRRKMERKKKKRRTASSQSPPDLLDSLHQRFGRCTSDYNSNDDDEDDDEEERIETTNRDRNNTLLTKNTNKRGPSTQKNKGRGTSTTTNSGGGCHFKKGEEIRLSLVLKKVVSEALRNGHTVHITGHSLGGALASLLVLDVLMNQNENDTYNNDSKENDDADSSIYNNLYLWTFGAPQLADTLFLESATSSSLRLRNFLGMTGGGAPDSDHRSKGRYRRYRDKRISSSRQHRKQFHRYVTVSDDGKVDVVSEVAKSTLAAHKEHIIEQHNEQQQQKHHVLQDKEKHEGEGDEEQQQDTTVSTTNSSTTDEKKKKKKKPHNYKRRRKWKRTHLFHGKLARRFGGVSRGGHAVTHFMEPHYLWTPDQQQRHDEYYHSYSQCHNPSATTPNSSDTTTDSNNIKKQKNNATSSSSSSNTRSSVAAHAMNNYLMGISREACSSSTTTTNNNSHSTRKSSSASTLFNGGGSSDVPHSYHNCNNPLFPDVPIKWLEFMGIAAAQHV